MTIYDINGKALSGNSNSLSHGNSVIGNTYDGMSNEYITMVQANYNSFLSEIKGDFNKIPIIVHTDHHHRSIESVFKLCNDMVDWYEISKIINLGDTCSNVFDEENLAKYRGYAENNIPLNKRLEIYGNNDFWDADTDQKYSVNQKRLSPYFYNVDARRYSNNGFFTVIDDYRNVKYLVISDFEDNTFKKRISTAQAKFIMEELSAKDGYDIILLSHVPFDTTTLTSRDASYSAYTETFLYDTTAQASLMDMIKARRNNTSGTFVDCYGVEHPYDFTDVSSKLLMSLHGHAHFEAYHTFENSITQFIFDWFNGNTFYFGYVDRENMKFKCWKNEIGIEALEIDI